MSFIINPGSGPVVGATLENAQANLKALIFDCELPFGVEVKRVEKQDERGRFCFKIEGNNNSVEVEMPGLPLEQVRFMDNPGQNIWNYPRLYVDKSSWVWVYAIGILSDRLIGGENDEED